MSEAMDQVATDVLADLMGVDVDEAPSADAPGEQPEEAVAPVAHETAATVDLDPELPEEVAAYLDEPDFVSEDEPEAEEEAENSDDDAEEWEEPEVAKLRKQLAKERSRREHAEKLRVQSQRGTWEKEAKRYFPLAEAQFASITASSRRGFLREAQRIHQGLLPFVRDVVDEAKRLAAEAREKAREEDRANAEQAWGKPLAGPGAPPSDFKAKQDEIEKARASGSLQRLIKTMLKNDNPL